MRPSIVAALLLSLAFGLIDSSAVETSVVQMLVPGFSVEELPVKLSNQNNLRFAPDGTLTTLGYDGKIWRLRDANGDGLEDTAEPFWDKPTLSVPLGMAWSSHGLFVSSKGKVSLLKDTDTNGIADTEEILASGWPRTDVGSGGVDATAVTLDEQGNVYFGLLVADYSNAYRLRKRSQLKLEEISWLKEKGRWTEPSGPKSGDDQFSVYDIHSQRGAIQKWDPRTKKLSTIATGIRVPVALAFNRTGELFNTDQEGETWMPNGNPLDELNQIISGQNYGFPPRHEQWLPDLVSMPPIVGFGPQHQSACGLVFNEPHEGLKKRSKNDGSLVPTRAPQKLFGPELWEGNALVAGQSRGKIWRVHLVKTKTGYVAQVQTIARLSMLTTDLAISPRGELYVACHSGPPDWGTGPKGEGKIFRVSYKEPSQPLPVSAAPASPNELHITFDKPLHQDAIDFATSTNAQIEFGEYVSAGDRFETLKPPYSIVQQQAATPRGRLPIQSARLINYHRTLALTTAPHPLAVRYAVTLPGIKARGAEGSGNTVDLDYDLTHASQPLPKKTETISRERWHQLLEWAPKAKASAGTDSRAPRKPDGDWEKGRSLFFGAQLQCAKCHRIRGEGGLAGPDLSNLLHRDSTSVLRDIREPNATLHPDYVTFRVAFNDGEAVDGFVRSQDQQSVRLFDANGMETAIPRSKVKSIQPTELSLMPTGLLDHLKENNVRDLLTFLMWEPPKHTPEAAKKLLSRIISPQVQASIEKELRLVLVATKQDHDAGQHDYPNWQTNWSRLLAQGTNVIAETAWEWPTVDQFKSASAIVFYCWNHNWSPERLAQVDAFLERGGGIALIHSAVIADKEPETLAQRIGLSAQPRRTSYRHMPFELRLNDREHPITRRFPERIQMLDEPYWPLIGDPADVHVLASATVDGEARPLIWTQQKGKGRIFASIPGHYTWTFENPLFRLLLLRGIAWVSGEDPARLEPLALSPR